MSSSWNRLGFIGLGCSVVGICLGFTSVAAAHIRLSKPLARYEITGIETGIKGCPCGLATGGGNSDRTCNVALDGSDPNRNEARASTFPAGSTIKLEFEEYIGHGGRYRVAFDPDGADFEDFNANVLVDEPDPNGNQGNIDDGSKWEIEVTLPNVACDNCTLQLLQVMEGGTQNPVNGDNLARLSTYYTCIDLTLTAPEGNTSDETSGDSTSNTTSETSGDITTTTESPTTTTAEVTTNSDNSTSGTETTSPPSSTQAESTTSVATHTSTGESSRPASTTTTSGLSSADGAADTAPAPSAPSGSEDEASDEGKSGSGGCAVANASRSSSSASLAWTVLLGAAAVFWMRRRFV